MEHMHRTADMAENFRIKLSMNYFAGAKVRNIPQAPKFCTG